MSVNESGNNNDKSLRDQLLYLIRGGGAHLSFDDFVADFPARSCNRKIEGLPYTAWQVLEHMRTVEGRDWNEVEHDQHEIQPEPDEGHGLKNGGGHLEARDRPPDHAEQREQERAANGDQQIDEDPGQ